MDIRNRLEEEIIKMLLATIMSDWENMNDLNSSFGAFLYF